MASFPGQKGTGAPLPNPVTTLTAVEQSATSVLLSWLAPGGATSYNVYRGGVLLAAGVLTTTYTDNTVVANTTYSYTVQGMNANGAGPGSPIATATTPPGQVQGLAATAQSSSSIGLTWSALAGASTYTVERGGTPIGTPSTPAFTDTGLSPNTTYSYQVAGNGAGGQGSFSAPASATTMASQIQIKFVPGHWGATGGLCMPFDPGKTNGGTCHASDFFGEMDDMLQDPWIMGYDAHFTWAALDYGYGTFTGSVGGATSGTLTGPLANRPFNGGYIVVFGDVAGATPTVTNRRAQVVGTTVTWSGALPAGSITTAHFYYVDVIDAELQRCKTNYSALKYYGLTVIPMQFHINPGGRVDNLTVPVFITSNVGLYGSSPDGGSSGWWGQKAVANWNAGTSYSAGQFVAFSDNATYQAKTAALGAGQAPGNTTFWTKVGVVGQYTSATYRPNVALEYGKLGQALGWAYNADLAFHHIKDQEPSAVAGPANAGTEFGPPCSNDPTYDHADVNYITAMKTYLTMWVNAFPITNVIEENTWLAWNPTNVQNFEAWMMDKTVAGRAHVVMPGSADTVGIEYFNAGNQIPSWGLSAYAGITVAGSTFSGPDMRSVARVMLDVEQPDIGSTDTTNVNRGVPSTPLSIIQAANSQYQACLLFWCHVANDPGITWRGNGGTLSITAVLSANPVVNTGYPGNYP